MKLKKITAMVLSICMIAGSISGCGGNSDKNKEEKDGTKKMVGKYIEENVKIPLKQNESMQRLLKNKEGGIEVYALEEASGSYSRYVSQDGVEWKAEDASWLTQIPNGSVVSIAAGEDGSSYAIVTDENFKMHLLKQTGEGTAEEINVPELNEAGEVSEDSSFYYFGTELHVMENGNLVLEGNKEVKVYNAASGNLLHSIPYDKTSTDALNPVDVNGKNIVLPNKENTGFTIWNIEEKKEIASMSYGSDVRNGDVILGDSNEIYFMNQEGIHHMQPEGTLVETLAEGGNMTMGSPVSHAIDFIKGASDDFYGLFDTGSNQVTVKHYYYDKDAKTDSGKKFSIYSLEENATVRQAVGIFSQKYPEVEVSYKTGESDSSTTKADKIRVLNTELLNKSGADVLILDQLPVDSLLEKGVLKDISNIVKPLISDGTLQKDLAECYQQEDGSIYAIPARYGLPILYGNQEMIDALDSLNNLKTWLDTHENQLFMDSVSYGELTGLFTNMYQDELMDKDVTLNKENLETCLYCIKEIGKRIDAELEKEYISEETGEKMEDMEGVKLSSWQVGNSVGSMNEEQVVSEEITSVMDLMVPFTVMREKNFPLRFNQDTFVPHGLAGINSASENTEFAEDFIKILFSQEVQECDMFDGLPMNQNASAILKEQGLDYVGEKDKDGTLVGISGTDETDTMSFGMPLKTEIEDMLNKAKELKKSSEEDSVLQDIVFEEAKMYYEGNQELEQTIQGITAKADTYYAE